MAFRFRQILVYRLGCRTISQFIPSTSHISHFAALHSLSNSEEQSRTSTLVLALITSCSPFRLHRTNNSLLKKSSAYLPSQSRLLLHVRRLGWRIEVLLSLRQCRRMQGLDSVDPRKKKGEIYRRVSRKAFKNMHADSRCTRCYAGVMSGVSRLWFGR